MQPEFVEPQTVDDPEKILNTDLSSIELDNIAAEAPSSVEPMRFSSHFVDCMEMYAAPETVAKYLDDHQGWFSRCAHPMKVEPLGQNGYALVIGRFGAFGYQVEPKVGLDLLPPEEGIYRILTIPVPNYVAPGYEVDFNAKMQLVEASVNSSDVPSAMTRVEWELDLAVDLQFPKFIYKLSKSLLQSTGDNLLCQIVGQVSRRLTHKVQQDFHTSLGIPFPPKSKKR
ncbi:MAG TPA: DUF1997 domain-containing protein [Candidatus Obscuribacterales bacterium]